MRLLTHNMLQCPRTKAYPLHLTAQTCDDVSVQFSAAFIERMIPRLDWKVFRSAAEQLPDAPMITLLPHDAPQDVSELEEPVCRAIHRALLEWHVVDGVLETDAGVRYKVSNGIPNLVITEVRQSDAVDVADAEEAADTVNTADPMNTDDQSQSQSGDKGADDGAAATNGSKSSDVPT